MDIRKYLPSSQFATSLSALFLAAIIIYGADRITNPVSTVRLENADAAADSGTWRGQFASSTSFQAASDLAAQAQQLIQASQTNNLTESVGRSLLIQTSAAQGQGVVASQPTQDSIVNTALSQISAAQPTTTEYTIKDISVVAENMASLHTYGNALVLAIQSHPQANYNQAMLAVSLAIDNQSDATLAGLPRIAKEYRALGKEVATLPVPSSLALFQLQLANNYAQMSDACLSMAKLISDPLQGLAGIQSYATLTAQNAQVFTQIANILKKDAILFDKGEAGAQWSLFLSAQQQAKAAAQVPAQ